MSKGINVGKVLVGAGLIIGAIAFTAIQNVKRKQEVIDISPKIQDEEIESHE